MATSVDCLKKRPFLKQTHAVKIKILKNGKPRPQLNLCVEAYGPNAKPEIFKMSNYDETDWLTGCEKRQRLFCWPCLLFGSPNPWNIIGMDGRMLKERIKYHQTEQKHIQALLAMQLFQKEHFPKEISDAHIVFNQFAKRNCVILQRIIDIVCFLVLQKQPLNKELEDKNALYEAECVEALQVFQEHDISDEEEAIIKDAIILLKNSKNVVNHIVDSIAHLMKLTIKKETEASAFVSIIFSGHGTVSTLECCRSTVLRYIKNGKVCEKFIGFHHIKKANSCDFFSHLSNVVIEYQLSQRVLALSVDGTFPRELLSDISNQLRTSYPYATLVPCHFHKFWDVLQQSIYFVNCNSFFEMGAAMVDFLQKDSIDFQSFLKGKVSGIVVFNRINTPDTLNLVKILRKHLIEYFNFIVQDCDQRKTDDCMKAYAFQQFLSEFNTVFWLEFFIKLFNLTNDICERLDSSMPETAFEDDSFSRLSTKLINIKDNGFEYFWNGLIDYLETDLHLANQIPNIDKFQCYQQFLDVLNFTIYQVKVRLHHLTDLEFFHLLNPSKFNPVFSIPHHLVAQVNTLYESSFDSPENLKTEMEKLYANNKAIIGFTVEQLLEYMNRYDSQKSYFGCLIKLAQLILTMPCKKPSDSKSSILDKIQAFSHSYTIYSGDCSLLCIESELFCEIRSKKSFYDDVITVFKKLNNSIDLLQYET